MPIRIANVLFFSFMIAINYLANALPLNGKTTGALSDQYPNLFVPSGITFAIWGVIYLLLLIFSILQFLPSYHEAVQRISPFVIINFSLNALWIYVWHYEYVWLSLLVMIGILYSLIEITKRVNEFSLEYLEIAFGIYLGWICIATIANTTALLVHIQWNAFSITEQSWALGLIAIGGGIVGIVMAKRNPYVALSVCWAFFGIYLKRQADFPIIAYFAILAMAVLAVFFVMLKTILRNSKV